MNCKFMNISLVSINHCPVHWHDSSIELIAVVSGSIRVKDGFEGHHLYEGDVIVINRDDLHAIYSTDEKNLIIILDIDIKYFEARYSSIKDTIIVCDSNTDKDKFSKQLRLIFLSTLNLYHHFFHNEITTDDEIENLGLNLLELLISNFRHLRIYEDRFISLGSDDLHAKTLGGIMDFIYRNFTNNISLDDISTEMNFSKFYVSHMIKNMSGLTFKEYIYMLRIEDSEKLLLTSRKSIAEIAYEYGFSDVKYYNKHFTRWYHVTPGIHRKKYLEIHNANGKQAQYLDFDLNDALNKINTYLIHAGYDVFTKGAPIQIDISGEPNSSSELTVYRFNRFEADFQNCSALVLNKALIEEACKELHLDTVKIGNMIQVHQHACPNVFSDMHEKLFDLIHDNKLNLIIYILLSDKPLKKNIKIEIQDLFHQYIARYGFDAISTWIIEISAIVDNESSADNVKHITNIIHSISEKIRIRYVKSEKKSVSPDQTNHIYDTVYIFPDIINNLLLKNNGLCDLPIKIIDSKISGAEIFSGDNGLITYNGLKKASYYLYYILAKLGEDIIKKEEHYILAKNKTSYQILLFNIPRKINAMIPDGNNKAGNLNTLVKNIIINFHDSGPYRILKYTINSKHGSIYNIWSNYGSPRYLSKQDEKLLSRTSFPKVEFEQLDQGKHKMEVKLDPYTVQLLEIIRI